MDLDAIEEDTFPNAEPEVEDASKEQRTTQLRPSLLTTVSELIAQFDEKYPKTPAPSALHPFSPEPPDTDILESVLHASGIIATTLAGHIPSSDERYESRSLEYVNHADAWLQPQIRARAIFRRILPTKRLYGADPPLDRSLLPHWIFKQIEGYTKGAGMDVFTESEPGGRTTLICGGKILVVDIELHQEESNTLRSEEPHLATHTATVQLTSLKITRASISDSGSSAAMGDSARHPSLERLLLESLRQYTEEAQNQQPDCIRLREMGEVFHDHLKALLSLDNLAHLEADGAGDRWFKELDIVDVIASDLAAREAAAITRSLDGTQVPLDIFINRSHGLPLACLVSPSTTVVIHISSQAYLSAIRTPGKALESHSLTKTLPLDIDLGTIRSYLTNSKTSRNLVTLATLSLSSTPDNPMSTTHLLSLLPPTFPLLSNGSQEPETSTPMELDLLSGSSTAAPSTAETVVPLDHLNHLFPVATSPTVSTGGTEDPKAGPSMPTTTGFVLDFGGIIMRRRAMSQLAWVDSSVMLGMGMESDVAGTEGYDAYGSPSWVDLLVDPKTTRRAPRYDAHYVHPAKSHPPLHHFLAASSEPGFVLGQIRVARMSDVWRMIEVVKEQAWLNDAMRAFGWKMADRHSGTGLGAPLSTDGHGQEDSIEDEFNSLLNGIEEPKEVSVQISVHATSPNPSIHFTVPLPLPTLPLSSFTVTYDPSAAKGVRAEIKAAPEGIDVTSWKESIEEIVRRGGIAILAGWVWKKASSLKK